MRVLVTGANGFIGSAVARALMLAGHQVLGLVRHRQRANGLARLGVELAIGEMADPSTYLPLVDQVEGVIHLAQQRPSGRWTRKKISTMHKSDQLMARTLAHACIARDIGLIYTSGALSHCGNGASWIDENTPWRPCQLALGHADMVKELQQLYAEQGLKVIVISPGFVYGPGGFLAETIALLKRNQYRVIGKGDNYWGLIHVDDLANLYVCALESRRYGENYFACDRYPLQRRTVIDMITTRLGMAPVGSVPCWIARLWLGAPLVEAITSSIRMRSDRATKLLGWSPNYRSFADALPDVLQQLALPDFNIAHVTSADRLTNPVA